MAIGGYFELELKKFGDTFHPNAILLNTGRNCLEFILFQNSYKKIYLPYYMCKVLLQPIERLGIAHEFYHLDEDFYPEKIIVQDQEALLYINYFGIMDANVQKLSLEYKNLIVDNSQSYFSKPITNVPTFYSPRKFFGLPDGGMVVTKVIKSLNYDKDTSYNRMLHLIKRIDISAEEGFIDFQENEKGLDHLPLLHMSNFTERLLKSIDFAEVSKKRLNNFNFLHKNLQKPNLLSGFLDKASYTVPLIYPFLSEKSEAIKEKLVKNRIYVATYWPDLSKALNDHEKLYSKSIIPLPIDQRYNEHDMSKIVEIILSFY